MNSLNQLVSELCMNYPDGGKEFFEKLDERVRHEDFFYQLVKLVIYNGIGFGGCTIVASGKFAIAFHNWATTISRSYSITGRRMLLVNGGIRDEEPVLGLEPFAADVRDQSFVFLDDSFFSGRTRDRIAKEIARLGGELVNTYVLYDGSHERDPSVHSLYRYHDDTWRT